METYGYDRILIPTDMSEIADESGADLLAIGAQHRRFSDASIIGTTSERLTRFARCPVLTIIRQAVVEETLEEKLVAV